MVRLHADMTVHLDQWYNLSEVVAILSAQPQEPALRSGAWGVGRRMVGIGRRYEGADGSIMGRAEVSGGESTISG